MGPFIWPVKVAFYRGAVATSAGRDSGVILCVRCKKYSFFLFLPNASFLLDFPLQYQHVLSVQETKHNLDKFSLVKSVFGILHISLAFCWKRFDKWKYLPSSNLDVFAFVSRMIVMKEDFYSVNPRCLIRHLSLWQ